MNAMVLLKLKGALSQFQSRHPKFSAFFKRMLEEGIQPDSVLEITIQRPDGSQMKANMRVSQEDLVLLEQLKGLQEEK